MFKLCLLIVAGIALGLQTVKGLIGGFPVKDGEFPHHVHLKRGRKFFCNGALIGTMHVLTTGTCIEKSISSIGEVTAKVGSNNLYKRGLVYNVKGQLIHPDYKGDDELRFDLGIYTLSSDILTSIVVKSAILPPWGPIDINLRAKVSSAGSTNSDPHFSQVIQKLYVDIIDQMACQNMLRCHFLVTESHICTMSPPRTGLNNNGDDGGPLVQGQVIVGIALRSTIPIAQNFPDIYTNVSYYRNWIDAVIN